MGSMTVPVVAMTVPVVAKSVAGAAARWQRQQPCQCWPPHREAAIKHRTEAKMDSAGRQRERMAT